MLDFVPTSAFQEKSRGRSGGWPQESRPSEVAPSRGAFRAGRAAWQERANRAITVMETKKVPAKELEGRRGCGGMKEGSSSS